MTTRSAVLGLVLAMTSSASGYAQPTACEDLAVPNCRERFIRSNMPKAHRPELQYGDGDGGLYIQIDDDISAARGLQSKQEAARADLAKADGYVFSITSLDSWRRYFRNEKARNVDAYNEAARRLADFQARKYQKYNDAIARTIELYHLAPQITQPIDHPDAVTRGPAIKPWAPHFSEAETIDKSTGIRRPFTDQERRERWKTERGVIIPDDQPAPPLVLGGTDADQASIAIFSGAFESPDTLASTIFHETVHWLDHNSVGRPFYAYEHDQSEVFAYGLMLEQQHAFNISTDQARLFEALKETYRKQAQKDSLSPGERRSHPGWLPSANTDIPPASRIVSPDGKRGDELDRIVAKAIRMARQRAIAQQAAKAAANSGNAPWGGNSDIGPTPFISPPAAAAPAMPAPAPALPAARANPYFLAEALRDIALKACENPAALTQSDVGRIAFIQYAVMQRSGQPTRKAADITGMRELGGALSGCPRQVFDGILEQIDRMNTFDDLGRITPDMVSALARRALNPAPTYSPRRRRDDDDPPPEEPKCHYENMGECCGGWVRICPG